ncbi:MAG: ABC-type transport auxiliary lipoprotein family protein [Pseudomonadales bacterium]|jgi:uncharacterized lipoprotein YmbA|nr:ABC-type transport auxiliary lipoprotein family protein [Pseudomonadales bacterium]
MNARFALLLWLLCLSALLCACASKAPAGLSYYVLGENTTTRAAPVDASLPALVLESVTLADYLQQSGLVLQQGEHQLQVSRSHLWAEGLELAVPEVLLGALREASPQYRYFLRGRDFVPESRYGLRLHLAAFQATDTGEVVASGRYQVVEAAAGREILNHQFNLREDLRADGYPQVVRQLRELLAQLARSIVNDLPGSRPSSNDPPVSAEPARVAP